MRLQMSACDEGLAAMEDMLGRFQGDLGAIGSEIRALQEQSAAMSVRLKNRQAAEGRLAGFLDSLALPPPLIHTILQVPHLLRLHASLLAQPWTQTCSQRTGSPA